MSIQIKVMSFNLRIGSDRDGDLHFRRRTDRILEVIRRESPDLIGFQEADAEGLPFLVEHLGEYTLLGHGRDRNYKGEAIPIAYRKDRFDLHNFRTEWLSLEPERPESRIGTDQGNCPRMFACAQLIHRKSNRPFSFFNVHTDNRGERARLLECSIVMRAVASIGMSFILTGDFNDTPDSESISLVLSTADSLGTADATCHIPGTFHSYHGNKPTDMPKIDYIFTNLPTDPKRSYLVSDDDKTIRNYSDHFAVCAYVDLP